MAYRFVDPMVVKNPSPIVSASTTPVVPVGTERRAVDSVLGEGTFKYLPGCGSAAVGIMVFYKQSLSGVASSGATPNTVSTGRPVAVAMGTVPSGTYGWFQITGNAIIKKNATKVSPLSKVFQSSTAGRIAGTGVTSAGKQIINAIATPSATVASATSTVIVEINRPSMAGA